MDISTLGNGDDLGTQHHPFGWIAEDAPPKRDSVAVVWGNGTHYYVNDKEVSKDEYHAVSKAQRDADIEARKEREFELASDAFTYAATLNDGVVLDWGRSYAAMEREGLKLAIIYLATPLAKCIMLTAKGAS